MRVVESLKRRARRLVSPPAVTPPIPRELTDVGSRRDLPLPSGWSRDQVFDLLASMSIGEAPAKELEGYLSEDFERFLITWSLVKDRSGRALEIGGNPYFTTVLLREFTDLHLTLTNSFDPTVTGISSQDVSYRDPETGEIRSHVFDYHNVNVESTPFPFADASFDVVLFCEVIEHLLMDPVLALHEIKRVLRPGGTLVVSTPNVARLENVARLVAGVNMYDPYSGYGPYGRHNREFTRHELVLLLGFAGFDVVDHFSADVHAHHSASFVDPSSLAPLLADRLADLGQYLFCTSTNTRAERAGRPAELYRSLSNEALVSWG